MPFSLATSRMVIPARPLTGEPFMVKVISFSISFRAIACFMGTAIT